MCGIDGCDNPAALPRPNCWGHTKRKTRGRPLNSPPLGAWGTQPWQRVLEAFYALDGASETGEQSWQRGQKRLRLAILRWVEKRKHSRPR